jgi:hypothetical protein
MLADPEKKMEAKQATARVQLKKNYKASAAQATVQAKTKGRGSKQDGKILTVIAIHKKSTDAVADSPDRETDGWKINYDQQASCKPKSRACRRTRRRHKSYERKGTKTRWTDIDSGCNSQ